jgi:hypothetical protein
VQVDDLAQADPDRHLAAAEGERKRGAVCEYRLAAALRPRRQLLAGEHAAGLAVDEACGDLRAADVDSDRTSRASHAIQNAALTAL